MSRIGKTPIMLPGGVTVSLADEQISVQGPKGSLQLKLPSMLKMQIQNNSITLSEEIPDNANIHGLYRSLISNAVLGVSVGWNKNLELVGVGYKAQGTGNEITLLVGFTHPVKIQAPANISFTVTDNTKITISGIDKKMVGEIAAKIRNVKPPEPYKGKGIRYAGEIVRKKAGKAVKAAGVPA